jgi:hypothetical protein
VTSAQAVFEDIFALAAIFDPKIAFGTSWALGNLAAEQRTALATRLRGSRSCGASPTF